MDSNSELNPALPQETRDAIRAGLLEAEARQCDSKAYVYERLAAKDWVAPYGAEIMRHDAENFRNEARSKREKAARLRAGGAK